MPCNLWLLPWVCRARVLLPLAFSFIIYFIYCRAQNKLELAKMGVRLWNGNSRGPHDCSAPGEPREPERCASATRGFRSADVWCLHLCPVKFSDLQNSLYLASWIKLFFLFISFFFSFLFLPTLSRKIQPPFLKEELTRKQTQLCNLLPTGSTTPQASVSLLTS